MEYEYKGEYFSPHEDLKKSKSYMYYGVLYSLDALKKMLGEKRIRREEKKAELADIDYNIESISDDDERRGHYSDRRRFRLKKLVDSREEVEGVIKRINENIVEIKRIIKDHGTKNPYAITDFLNQEAKDGWSLFSMVNIPSNFAGGGDTIPFETGYWEGPDEDGVVRPRLRSGAPTNSIYMGTNNTLLLTFQRVKNPDISSEMLKLSCK